MYANQTLSTKMTHDGLFQHLGGKGVQSASTFFTMEIHERVY